MGIFRCPVAFPKNPHNCQQSAVRGARKTHAQRIGCPLDVCSARHDIFCLSNVQQSDCHPHHFAILSFAIILITPPPVVFSHPLFSVLASFERD